MLHSTVDKYIAKIPPAKLFNAVFCCLCITSIAVKFGKAKNCELIEKGCVNFNAALAITRNLKNGIALKNVFVAVIIAKMNAEDDLRQLLENSASEPTLLTVKPTTI